MSKIRVYELAQKMGIENKELMTKLQAVGVDVKSHTASVDEADVKKLAISEPPAKPDNSPTVKEVSKEEIRVTTNIIRRRAKVVESAPVRPERNCLRCRKRHPSRKSNRSDGRGKVTEAKVPEVKVPEAKVPEAKVPEAKVPEAAVVEPVQEKQEAPPLLRLNP